MPTIEKVALENVSEAAKAASVMKRKLNKGTWNVPSCRHELQASVIGSEVFFRVVPRRKYHAPCLPEKRLVETSMPSPAPTSLSSPAAPRERRRWPCPKGCGFEAASPVLLGRHYEKHPDHRSVKP